MSKTRVYSYLRFSDPKQEAGHSVERQLAFARKWADDHGAELDTDLTMRDEGLSAYHQRHVKHGALGVFLRAVDEGRISKDAMPRSSKRTGRVMILTIPCFAEAHITSLISLPSS